MNIYMFINVHCSILNKINLNKKSPILYRECSVYCSFGIVSRSFCHKGWYIGCLPTCHGCLSCLFFISVLFRAVQSFHYNVHLPLIKARADTVSWLMTKSGPYSSYHAQSGHITALFLMIYKICLRGHCGTVHRATHIPKHIIYSVSISAF